jgi:hypothetical protein
MPYLYMQNTQNGTTGHAGPTDPAAVTVVIVTVKNKPDARSAWLDRACKYWGQTAHGRPHHVRVLLHQVKDEAEVLYGLTHEVLPRMRGPVVVIHGNNTAIRTVNLDTWIRHWVRSDVPIWCTAVQDNAVIEQWYLTHVLGLAPACTGPAQPTTPVWGIFSGVAEAVLPLLVAVEAEDDQRRRRSGKRAMTMTAALCSLALQGHVYCDATVGLVDIGLHWQPERVAGLSPHTQDKLMQLCVRVGPIPRAAARLRAALYTRDSKVIVASATVMVVLLALVAVLAVALCCAGPRRAPKAR